MTTKENIITSLTFKFPSDREAVMECVFDAPRELVFKTYTDPNLIPEWRGPKGYTTTVDKMEVRPGGSWRFIQRGPDGHEDVFGGVYREVVPPERLVYTIEIEGTSDPGVLESGRFEEHNGKTKLTDTVLFQTVEDRDQTLKSGIQKGAAEIMDRFAELLAKILNEKK